MQAHRTSEAQLLVSECEALAGTRFSVPIQVIVGVVPSLPGDFWQAEVVQTTASQASTNGGASVTPLRAELAILCACQARSKGAALEALRAQLQTIPERG